MTTQPRLNVIGAIILVLIVGVGVWWLVSDDDSNERQPERPVVESVPVDEAESSTLPSTGTADTRIKSVDRVIRNFVSAYYARSQTVDATTVTSQLRPLVTPRFMREFFPDLSRQGDPWFRTGDGAVTATGSPVPADYFEVPDTMAVIVQVSQRQAANDDGLADEYSFTVTVELMWSDGWRVNSFL